jgi:uncharacterized membrane protein YccF (DUF307 family)
MADASWNCKACNRLNAPDRRTCKHCGTVRGLGKDYKPSFSEVPVPTSPSAEMSSQPNVIIQQASGGEPGCLIQGIWFLFVGWWLGGLAVSLAWLLNVLIITLPLGMAILNNVPKVLALQNPQKSLRVVQEGNITRVTEVNVAQHPFLIRAIYFLLIGWWWSGIWMGLAYFLCGLIVTMPIGLGMFRSTPAMTTLQRY